MPGAVVHGGSYSYGRTSSGSRKHYSSGSVAVGGTYRPPASHPTKPKSTSSRPPVHYGGTVVGSSRPYDPNRPRHSGSVAVVPSIPYRPGNSGSKPTTKPSDPPAPAKPNQTFWQKVKAAVEKIFSGW